MLPKAYRLESNRIFDIIKSGRRINGKYLSVKYLPSDRLQCAVVVSKKHVATIVERNLTKRWIRHAFLDLVRENLIGDFTLVITTLSGRDYNFTNISQDLRNIALSMKKNMPNKEK